MAGEDDRGEYDLAAGPRGRPLSKPAPAGRRVNAESGVPLAYERKSAGGEPFSPETLINRRAPIVLLGCSLLVHFARAWLQAMPGESVHAIGAVGIQLMISTGLMLVCVFAASRARGFRLGPLPEAILKLMAVAVTPSAAIILLSMPLRFIPFGVLGAWFGGFCLYFALLGLFFDLDQEDTWLCVILIFVVQVTVYLAVRLG